jgi:hypothetical protein
MDMRREEHGLRERAGLWVGRAWATPIAMISALRRARMFHPRGLLFSGRVVACPASRFATAARRIEGHALVRLSGALAKRDVERFEVLGVGLRISSAPIESARPSPGDQDLLFATILSPVTMPTAPFTTRSDDFLANRYWGVAPFHLEGVGRVKLRLTPMSAPHVAGRRSDRISSAVAAHRARFSLEVRRTLHVGWEPLAMVVLEQASDVDQEALRFDPFRAGRGIAPVGFVQSIRKRVYAAGQSARPSRSL